MSTVIIIAGKQSIIGFEMVIQSQPIHSKFSNNNLTMSDQAPDIDIIPGDLTHSKLAISSDLTPPLSSSISATTTDNSNKRHVDDLVTDGSNSSITQDT